MSEVGNLGSESVGSMENNQACYLGMNACPSPLPPPENFEFSGHIVDYLSMVTKIKLCSWLLVFLRANNYDCSIRVCNCSMKGPN